MSYGVEKHKKKMNIYNEMQKMHNLKTQRKVVNTYIDHKQKHIKEAVKVSHNKSVTLPANRTISLLQNKLKI